MLAAHGLHVEGLKRTGQPGAVHQLHVLAVAMRRV